MRRERKKRQPTVLQLQRELRRERALLRKERAKTRAFEEKDKKRALEGVVTHQLSIIKTAASTRRSRARQRFRETGKWPRKRERRSPGRQGYWARLRAVQAQLAIQGKIMGIAQVRALVRERSENGERMFKELESP